MFEERVNSDKGDWLYIYKYHSSTHSEEELAKIRKAKPKTLNLNDLNPVTMRAWLDYSALGESDSKEITIRAKLLQVLDENAPAETPKPVL